MILIALSCSFKPLHLKIPLNLILMQIFVVFQSKHFKDEMAFGKIQRHSPLVLHFLQTKSLRNNCDVLQIMIANLKIPDIELLYP